MIEGNLYEILYNNTHLYELNRCFDDLIEKGHYEALSKIKLIAEEEGVDYNSYIRRPYYRLRGKRVTEEQALEIIARTDDFTAEIIGTHQNKGLNMVNIENHLPLNHLRNFWLVKNHMPPSTGWIQPSGIVGGNGITDKYPNFDELMTDVIKLKIAFPELKFIWAVSIWNEAPYEEWIRSYNENYVSDENYPNFEESIEIVFHSHDDVIEVLGEENGAKSYKEMLPIYEESVNDPYIYTPSYYYRKKENPVSREFLKRSLEVYGLTLEYHDNLENGSWLPQNK